MNFLESLPVPLQDFIAQTHLHLIIPEIVLVLFILLAVGKLSFSKSRDEREQVWGYSVWTLVLLLLAFAGFWQAGYGMGPAQDVFYGMFRADLFSLVIRTLLVLGTLITLLFTRAFIRKNAEVPGEFYPILLSALLGGMMLSGANDLIMVFVSLETLSISSYILVGYMRGNLPSAEAGLKYLLYGGMATAVLLFGVSILYGLTGQTRYDAILEALRALGPIHPLILAMMTIMILGGLCFKLSAAPFHMWAPDAYEGAPTPVVAFLSVVSKIAGFSLAIRLLTLMLSGLDLAQGWIGLMGVLSVLSMLIGNVVALTQRNLKRLMAYSTVAHVGYMLLGFVVLTSVPQASVPLGALLYYLLAYLFMNLGAFAVITHVETLTGRSDIAAYAGLVRKRPFLAGCLSVMLLSLAGIPITAGFFGKFFLFQAVADAGQSYLWLVGVALLTSTISLYYYLNVMRVMLILDPSDAVEALSESDPGSGLFKPVGLALTLCLTATLALGVFAEGFLRLASQAVADVVEDSGTYSARPERPVVSAKALSQSHSAGVRGF